MRVLAPPLEGEPTHSCIAVHKITTVELWRLLLALLMIVTTAIVEVLTNVMAAV